MPSLPSYLSAATAEKWLFPIVSISFVSVLLFISAISGFSASSVLYTRPPPIAFFRHGPTGPPSFAYLLAGGRGDARRLLRLLLAVYHPRNRYVLHLSADAPDSDRAKLAAAVYRYIPAARAFDNVDIIGRPTAGTAMGSSGLAATLRAAAVMLHLDPGWDWFVTLSAADYPLVTQDDLIHVFSSVPRDMNFVDHSSVLGWKEDQRVQPIIVDAGIYLAGRNQFFQATEKRKAPDAFKFFTGSPLVILSRNFIEYCILGWENLPRTLLLYFTNVISSQEGYFHSVICNSPNFQNLTVNSDLRYAIWNNPLSTEPLSLNITSYNKMLRSGMPFGRQFNENEPVLDKIDTEVLNRWGHRVVPGAWCSGKRSWFSDPCAKWSNVNLVNPRPEADKFHLSMKRILQEAKTTSSCMQ